MGRWLFAIVAVWPLGAAPAAAQLEPLFHGVLSVRPASGGIDRSVGSGSLVVKKWDFTLAPDSNGIAPDREPTIIALGETERLVIPAGQMIPRAGGKRFAYRNPKVGRDDRGVRSIDVIRLKSGADGAPRYRIKFTIHGIDLSRLLIEYPVCSPLAVIVGDDDGFSGVELDRPGIRSSRVRVLGACTDVGDWPWL